MKRIVFFLLALFMLLPAATGRAQKMVTAIDSLVIDIWPDYDRASVLVLLTGTLPGDTQFPASVTLPLPEGAQLHAVARIDGKDGEMKDDISYIPGPGGVMFNTPDLHFRMEYYFPYTVTNKRRSFDFTWLADLPVNKLEIRVQQPLSATSLTTEPVSGSVIRGEDGFNYHTFSKGPVPAEKPFSVHVDYEMNSNQLSAERMPPPTAGAQTPGKSPASTARKGINWPTVAIVFGGLLIAIVLFRQIAGRRAMPDRDEPLPRRTNKKSRPNFCHECGEPVDENDKYCSACGLEL